MAPKKYEDLTQSQIEEFARALATETFALIEEDPTNKKLEVTITFLSIFIGSLVYKSLTMVPENPMGKMDLLDYTEDNFKMMKENIQNAICSGFKGALEEYSGREMDYYCKISPIGEPINKTPC